jgi:hypothetical protein
MSGMAARIGEWKPVMAMLIFDLISAVTTALIKKALQEGLDRLVLITLRQLVATVFLAPIAYFRERYIYAVVRCRKKCMRDVVFSVKWMAEVQIDDSEPKLVARLL